MEKFDQKAVSIKETGPKVLTGQEGLDLLKSSTSRVEGISLSDFFQTPEGKEAMKKKKIILAGPPRSGKSCFRQGLKEVIRTTTNGQSYAYVLTACPDGEGSWFQEAMNADPSLANKYKAEYKQKFTPEHGRMYAEWVKNLSSPNNPNSLNFIDIGGVMSDENRLICAQANGAVILAGQSSVENDLPGQWKDFFSELGIPIVAEIYSDYHGKEDIVEGVGEDGVFRGSVHHLERGEKLGDRETIKGFADYIINLGKQENTGKAEK